MKMDAQNIILFITIFSATCKEDFKIKIGLPEYICEKNGVLKRISNDLTSIRLLDKQDANISFQFEVDFHSSLKCNQRCTLLIWKTIRDLNSYLKNYPLSKLQSGMIDFNNSMFKPGVQYFINIKIFKEAEKTEEKQLIVDSRDENAIASLFLLGSNFSYAFSTYVLNAEVNICYNISSYHLKWQIIKPEITEFSYKGLELIIPEDTFQGFQTYTIECSLIIDEEVIAKAWKNVNILSKNLFLRLPIKQITARVGQEVKLKPYIKDMDNLDGHVEVSWFCLDTTTGEDCQYESGINESEITNFDQTGIYQITLDISKNNSTESEISTIEVLEKIPIIEIEDFDIPFNPKTTIEIKVTIYELKNFCTLQWTSIADDGYKFLNLTQMPGKFDEIFNVTTNNELEEYSNDTIDKKFNLIIPSADESWDGLASDCKYLLKLLITCPMLPQASASIEIETKEPPKIKILDVTPLTGEAFVTIFTFQTERIQAEAILYKFGYFLKNEKIILKTLGDINSFDTTLPFNSEGVQTFLECCDSYKICSQILGPLVDTKLPKIDKNKILQRFTTQLNFEDYSRAFLEAFAIISSFETPDFRDFISDKISAEIDKYLNSSENNENANLLLIKINEFNSKLDLPEIVINKVLDLRNKLSHSDPLIGRKLLSLRPQRSSSLTLHDVKSYLEISELIITTSNDPNKINSEKMNLVKRLLIYMEKLCSNMKKSQVYLELKTVVFAVEKMKKNSMNNFVSVPFEGNSWQVNSRIKLGNIIKDSKEKCLGKAMFKGYFEKVGISFFINVLNVSKEDVNETGEIVVFLPKNQSMEGSPRCLVYYDDVWHYECKIRQNLANFVKCSCYHLGYYYLEYVKEITLAPFTTYTTLPSVTPTQISNFSSQISEKKAEKNYDTISYIVIGVSVFGITILIIAVRKIFHDDDDETEDETFEFPKYAQLYNEEFLNDAHI